MAVQYNNRLRGRTVMILPASCRTVWWLLWGTADTKSKSSTFPLAGVGGGGQCSQVV